MEQHIMMRSTKLVIAVVDLGSEQDPGQGHRRPGSKMGPLYPARTPIMRIVIQPIVEHAQGKREAVEVGVIQRASDAEESDPNRGRLRHEDWHSCDEFARCALALPPTLWITLSRTRSI